jgi:hypothetical protein
LEEKNRGFPGQKIGRRAIGRKEGRKEEYLDNFIQLYGVFLRY